jgi:uncharacterized protein (TIGR03905 family)
VGDIMKHYTYDTINTCSRKIEFDLTDDLKITNIVFHGGCNGNLKAIAKLCEGKDANTIKDILAGNTCGMRPTSCGDQLSIAISKALNKA